jgi:outer membrane biosynthesis protein TonB
MAKIELHITFDSDSKSDVLTLSAISSAIAAGRSGNVQQPVVKTAPEAGAVTTVLLTAQDPASNQMELPLETKKVDKPAPEKKTKPKAEEKPEPVSETKTPAEESKGVTIDDVRKELAKKINADGNRAKIKTKLTELEANNVTVLDPSKYAEMHKFLLAL